MFPLSTRSKEAIKTSLAIVIAYAISLSMGWEKPVWAGFTVAFISLPTIRKTINKSLIKMLGTLEAGLSERLRSDGGSVEEWKQLIRSYAVLVD